MIVKDIMKKPATTCGSDSDLASVAAVMRDRGCGFVPVVDGHGVVVGVLTDRDICLASAVTHRPLERVSASDTMSHPVFSCFSDENIKVVLVTMARHRVRRLPVLTKAGHLEGVLSIDDIVRAPQRRGGPTAEDIVSALRGIYAERSIEPATA